MRTMHGQVPNLANGPTGLGPHLDLRTDSSPLTFSPFPCPLFRLINLLSGWLKRCFRPKKPRLPLEVESTRFVRQWAFLIWKSSRNTLLLSLDVPVHNFISVLSFTTFSRNPLLSAMLEVCDLQKPGLSLEVESTRS